MKNGCVLKGGVGSGKSRTALAYFFLKECGGSLKVNGKGNKGPMARPRDLYIITTAKKRDARDWEEECADFGLSIYRDASFDSVKVTVDSWNNILQYEEYTDAFFIFDEQRLVGSGAWTKAFLKIAKKNHWIMLSATPGDNWMDYIPIFVANGFYKNRTEFLRTHVVFSRFSKFPKVDRYVETGRLERLRRRILVEMPVEKHTVRHVHELLTEYDEAQFEKVVKGRWNIYEDQPIKDVADLFRVMRKLVNSDPSRLEMVEALHRKHPKLIVFYNFNYELDLLMTLADTTGASIGQWNGRKHEPIPKGDSWIYLVQYTAGAEGWNCVQTDATVFYSLNYSYKINEQAKGRIDRRNTPYTDLHYYILKSASMIDKAIFRTLLEKRNFNEKDFGDW